MEQLNFPDEYIGMQKENLTAKIRHLITININEVEDNSFPMLFYSHPTRTPLSRIPLPPQYFVKIKSAYLTALSNRCQKAGKPTFQMKYVAAIPCISLANLANPT